MHELQLGGQRVKTVVGEASRICRGAGNSSPTAAGATLSAPPAAIVCFAPRFGPSAPLVSSPSFPRCLPLLREFSPSPFSLRAPRPRSATRWQSGYPPELSSRSPPEHSYGGQSQSIMRPTRPAWRVSFVNEATPRSTEMLPSERPWHPSTFGADRQAAAITPPS